jgi:hypothetical protein
MQEAQHTASGARGGGWAQKHAGYKVEQTTLPKGDDATIWIYPNPEETAVRDEARAVSRDAKKRLPKSRVAVPDYLVDPHPLVVNTAAILNTSSSDETGRVRSSDSQCMTIEVSKAALSRALLIVDTVVKTLLSMEHTVVVSQGQTKVEIDGVPIMIALREELPRVRLRAKDHDLEQHYYQFGYGLYEGSPTVSGMLRLSIEDAPPRYEPQYRTTWRDSGSLKLEDSLNSFIAGLLRVAAKRRGSVTQGQEKDQNDSEERP